MIGLRLPNGAAGRVISDGAAEGLCLGPATVEPMADPLPTEPDVEADPEEARVVGMSDEEAGDVLSVLSADTARAILGALYEEPGPANELADRTDTSIQNAQYHLENLAEAGLVEVADTAYSPKGREMDVYVPSDRAVVVVPPQDSAGLGLSELLSALVPLGVLAVLVEFLLGGPFAPDVSVFATTTGGGTESADVAAATTEAQAAAQPGLVEQLAASPGLAVFAGGLVALAVLAAVVTVRRR